MVLIIALYMFLLQNLTGGTLLSRNKEYIVFYRGNDFLPPDVMNTVKERLELTNLQQIEEEQVRQLAASAAITSKSRVPGTPLVAGTLKETLAALARWGNDQNSEDVERMRRYSSLEKHAALVRSLQKKLSLVSHIIPHSPPIFFNLFRNALIEYDNQ